MSDIEMAEYQSILPVVREYKRLWLETQKINEEIKQYRLKFKPRLMKLKEEQDKLQKVILEFMEKYKHPGIRDQDTTILKHDKKKKSSISTRASEVEEILTRCNIPKDTQQTVIDVLKGNKDTDLQATLKLKVSK
jgi:hypothetical protein